MFMARASSLSALPIFWRPDARMTEEELHRAEFGWRSSSGTVYRNYGFNAILNNATRHTSIDDPESNESKKIY